MNTAAEVYSSLAATTTVDLTRAEWSVHLDEAARWEDDDLDDLDRLPERAPTGGWSVLDAGQAIRVPASTYDIAPAYHGVSWWSTDFEVAAGPALVHFLGARLLAEVYVDRKRVHLDLEGMTPFTARLPAGLQPGRHRLDLRLTDPGGGDSWVDVFPVNWGRFRLPASHGFGGPWLPIHIEQPGPVRISDLWARAADEAGSLLVDFRVEGQAVAPRRLRIEVDGPSGGVAETEIEVGDGVHSLAMALSRSDLYGPGHPNLHVCRLYDGEVLLAQARFGLRRLDFSDGHLRLNGDRFRMASSISWGWYRRGPVPSDGDCAREVESMLAFGMNTISAHRHMSTPALQDALEERGLLMHQEAGGIGTTIMPTLSDSEREEVERRSVLRLRRLARRDRGRACLAWWNLANEIQEHELERHRAYFTAAAAALREEDPTRLVTVTSGWGRTAMWRPFDAEPRESWDWHRVYAWPSAWTDAVEDEVVRYLPVEGGLSIDGESACFGSLGKLREILDSFGPDLPPGAGRQPWGAWVESIDAGLRRADPDGMLGGLEGVTAGTAAVQAHAFARLIEAHRRQPGMHGLATNGWHQHPRIGTSGIVAPDRSPVIDTEPLRRANAERALAFPRLTRAVWTGDGVDVNVELLGPHGSAGPVDAEIELSLDGRVVWQGRSPSHVLVAEPGIHTLRAVLDDLVVEDLVLAVALPSVSGPLAIFEPEPELLPWFIDHGVDVRNWRLGDKLPLLVVGNPSAGGGIPASALPRRAVNLQRSFGRGQVPSQWVLGGISVLEGRGGQPPNWMDVHASWVGGWAVTSSDLLPELGPPGVWGAERAAIYPRLASREAPGHWISAAISFPDATMFDVGVPAVGATSWVFEHGNTEVLTSVLPVVERRDDTVGAAALLSMAGWLTES